jgi:hypothetical protein
VKVRVGSAISLGFEADTPTSPASNAVLKPVPCRFSNRASSASGSSWISFTADRAVHLSPRSTRPTQDERRLERYPRLCRSTRSKACETGTISAHIHSLPAKNPQLSDVDPPMNS